jgi:hypothetical protein
MELPYVRIKKVHFACLGIATLAPFDMERVKREFLSCAAIERRKLWKGK